MVAKVIPAALKGSEPLKPADAEMLETVMASQPKRFWARFWRGMALAAKVVTIDDFQRACVNVHKELDGRAMKPEDAAATARRVIGAFTQAKCTVHVPKCECCDKATMVVWLGEPGTGFLFQRHMTLPDPKGAKHG